MPGPGHSAPACLTCPRGVSLCVSISDGELNSASRGAGNQIPTFAPHLPRRSCPGDGAPRPPRERLVAEAWEGGKPHAQCGAHVLLTPILGGKFQCEGDAPHGQQRAPLAVKCHVRGRAEPWAHLCRLNNTLAWMAPQPSTLAPPTGPSSPVLLAQSS